MLFGIKTQLTLLMLIIVGYLDKQFVQIIILL